MMNVPEGWGYEGPDESVGIFGSTLWHDSCPNYNEAIESEPHMCVIETIMPMVRRGDSEVHITFYQCAHCDASFTTTEVYNVDGPVDEGDAADMIWEERQNELYDE